MKLDPKNRTAITVQRASKKTTNQYYGSKIKWSNACLIQFCIVLRLLNRSREINTHVRRSVPRRRFCRQLLWSLRLCPAMWLRWWIRSCCPMWSYLTERKSCIAKISNKGKQLLDVKCVIHTRSVSRYLYHALIETSQARVTSATKMHIKTSQSQNSRYWSSFQCTLPLH